MSPAKDPPPYRSAGTAIPAETRDDDSDEGGKLRSRSMVGRVIAALSPVSADQAGRWFLLTVAFLGFFAPGAYMWSHQTYGWGPCPHRTTLEILCDLAPPPPAAQPGGHVPRCPPGGAP